MSEPVYVTGVAQNYAWGRKGSKSSVAKLVKADTPNAINFSENEPYAELWYGTHPSGMSHVLPVETDKSIVVSGNGKALREELGEDLPFLLKVLSIGGALSLQAHPDLSLAQILHKNDPKNYKDGNHKPELVVALEPMHVLCGFRKAAEIVKFADLVPEFKQVLGSSYELLRDNGDIVALKEAFSKAMYADEVLVKDVTSAFFARCSDLAGVYQRNLLNAEYASEFASTDGHFVNFDENGVLALVHDLIAQYPGDIGAFGPFFLNYFPLQALQSVFLGPNEPHAYLFGDCVEIMACSDNVVRAGLTPKFRDVDTLVSMLTYSTEEPKVTYGTKVGVSQVYAPSNTFPEFMVQRTNVNNQTIALPALPVYSILLCTKGSGHVTIQNKTIPLAYGGAVLIPRNATCQVVSAEDMMVFRGSSNQFDHIKEKL